MKLQRADQPPTRPEDAALWWATKRQVDPVRFASDEAFALWVEEPNNSRAWEGIDRSVAATDLFAAMPEVRDMRQAALDFARSPRRSRKARWFLGPALAAGIALGAILIGQPGAGPLAPPAMTAANEEVRRVATALGERRDVVLSDGSRVTLNTGTEVEIDYASPDRRAIRLLRGQAMFQVARDAGRPFVVRAGTREIVAIGTAFDVRIESDGRVEVLLVEGKVRVDPVDRSALVRLVPSLARVELTPGEQLIVPSAGNEAVRKADVERVTAWNRGVVIFRDDSVADAVREMNRYSNDRLIVEDPRVARLKVSGIFPAANRDDFIEALEALYPVDAERDAAGGVRLRWAGDPVP